MKSRHNSLRERELAYSERTDLRPSEFTVLPCHLFGEECKTMRILIFSLVIWIWGCQSSDTENLDESETGWPPNSDAQSGLDANVYTNADKDAGLQTDVAIDMETDAAIDAYTTADSGATVDTGAHAAADPDARVDTGAYTVADTGTTADTGAHTDAETDADIDTDATMTAAALVADMGIGWNLGNSLDAPEGETAWGNPVTTEVLIRAVAAQGFGVIRLPITWSLHMGPGPDFPIDSTWMDRVDELVSYVLNNGLYAIINLHHDGADNYSGVEWITLNDQDGNITNANSAAVEARFVKVWEQIAARFINHDNRLLFESMNEIHDGYGTPDPGYYDIINNLNQVFVNTVRASGGNNAARCLVVPGYNTNIEYTLAGFVRPTDSVADKLILSVHYYDPWSFAGEASTRVWGAAYPGSDNWGQEDYVQSQFDHLRGQYIDNGLPVIIGEYGAVNNSGAELYRRYYMEYVTKAAKDRGIVPIYWDNGGVGSGSDKFALFDRNSHAVLYPDILDAMMRAAFYDYTIDDIVPP